MNKKSIIITLEIIVLAIIAVMIGQIKKEPSFEPVSLDQWRSKYIEQREGVWSVNEGDLAISGIIKLMQGPEMKLEKGSYTLTVLYECEEDQSFFPCADDPYDHYVSANEVKLDKNKSLAVYDFYIKQDVENFEVEFKYNGHGTLTISDISLQKNSNLLQKSFVLLFSAFVLYDVFFLWGTFSAEKKKYMCMLLGIALLCSLPLGYKGANNGHDFMFHLTRIESIAKEIRLRNFPIRISSAWLGEYGYPTSIYYGDILLYFPAFLRIFGFTVTEAYKTFLFAMNLLTTIVAEWCFRKIFIDKKISIILTLTYMTATYRMICIYVRSAVGESSTYLFLPLIALAVYKIYTDNDMLKKNIQNAVVLAIGMFGLINTHILTAEMVVFVLGIVCIICLKKTLKVQTIRTYLSAVFATIFLSMGFLVPFLDYYLNVSTEITSKVSGVAPAIQRKGINVSEFFAIVGNPFGQWGDINATPGVLLLLVYVIAIIMWYQKKSTTRMKKLILLSSITIFMATNLFPWDLLACKLRIFNFLAQVQFPWRYIGIVIILLSMLMGVIIVDTNYEEWRTNYKRICNFCIMISILMTCVFVSYYSDYAGRDVLYDTLDVNTYFVQGEEYLRTDTSIEDFTGKVEGEGVKSIKLLSRKGTDMDVLCSGGNEVGSVIFPVLNYKGYIITDNKGINYEVVDGDNNLVSCMIPANFEGALYLRFEEPWYWTLAFGVSLVSWTIVLVIFAADIVKYKKIRG